MQRFVYTRQDGKQFEHEYYCISHMFYKYDFDDEMSHAGFDLTYRTLKSVRVMPINRNRIVDGYPELISTYLKGHIDDDLSFSFHPRDSKAYVLFLSTFIRSIDEEGEFFQEGLLEAEGSLIRRLHTLYNKVNKVYDWENYLHQTFGPTIMMLVDNHVELIENRFTEFLEYLRRNGQPIHGSNNHPDNTETVGYLVKQSIKEISCQEYLS